MRLAAAPVPGREKNGNNDSAGNELNEIISKP
jgi:hypothetical protein